MLRVYIQLAMSVYRKRTFRRNDCVDGVDVNFEEVATDLWGTGVGKVVVCPRFSHENIYNFYRYM